MGNLADQALLYYYHYDPTTGKYGAIISRILQTTFGTCYHIGACHTPDGGVPSCSIVFHFGPCGPRPRPGA
jgi:hypothetical protein